MSRTVLGQHGFSALEAILLLLLGGIIGGTGFYVYHANNSVSDTYSSASRVAESEPAKTKTKATATSAAAAPAETKEVQLQTYLLKTCSAADATAINAVFKNQAVQNVDTDNIKLSGNYAIVNLSASCTLANGTQLSSLFLKYGTTWDLVVKVPTEVDCQFLTGQGFPDDLKAPYCQNQ